MTRMKAGIAAAILALLASSAVFAADLPGKFPGVSIDAKLIGGQQYEPLYARIAEWEKETGAKVNILSKKNHFELDKEIKELLDLHRTVTRLPDPIVDRNGMRHAMAMTEEKLRVLDQKVRQLRRMRRDVAQMLIALQKAAGDACPFLNRTPSPKQD